MAKPSSPSRKISGAIEERGPLTVAAFMDLALYDAEIGYYARVARRSGRAGDFFTSVDVGPIFGQLIARQVAEMANLLTVDRRPFAELTVVPSGIEGRLSTV